MNRLLAATLLILMAGCMKVDAEVARSKVSGSERTERGAVSCSKPGYCMVCGLGFNGEFNCKPGFKYSCPGTQRVTRRVWSADVRYESGLSRRVTDSEIISRDSACT